MSGWPVQMVVRVVWHKEVKQTNRIKNGMPFCRRAFHKLSADEVPCIAARCAGSLPVSRERLRLGTRYGTEGRESGVRTTMETVCWKTSGHGVDVGKHSWPTPDLVLETTWLGILKYVKRDLPICGATMTTAAAAAAGVGDSASSSSAMGHAFNAIPPKLHDRVQDNPHPSQMSFNGSSAMPAAPQNQSLDPLSQTIYSQSSSDMAHVHYQTPHPFDPSSIFPQHLMQEFIRLSTPVGQNPDDDNILARALCDSKQNGKTYRQALEGLHGVCRLCP